MTNRRRKGWRCRELVKSLRKKAGGVEATGKPPERGKLAISRRQANRQSEKGWRYRGDRQTARVRKAGGKISRLKYRQRKAGSQSDFRGEMPAAKLPDRDVGSSPPLQGNKNSCDAYTGENDKSDPDHADQNPWGCFRQGSIPHTAGNYDRDDHHADGVTDGAHSC